MTKNKRRAGNAFADVIGVALVFSLLLLIADPVWRLWAAAAPASNWIEVTSVKVHDVSLSASPVMEVSRNIHHPVRGNWIVEVERRGEAGGFYITCTARGENSYTTDRSLPDTLNLDWWTWPTQCNPTEAGVYRVSTRWTLYPEGYPPKPIVRTSNEFRAQ